MPNTPVRAAAGGLSDFPRNSQRFGFLRESLLSWNSRAASDPATPSSVSVEDKFMNQHVSRRTLITTGMAAGAAFVGVATTDERSAAMSIESIPDEKAFSSIDERLNRLPADVGTRLRKAFYEILDEVDAMIERGESDAAVAAHIDHWGSVFHGQLLAVTVGIGG